MVRVRGTDQPQDQQLLLERIDDPVFWDLCTGVVAALFEVVSGLSAWTYDLDHQVGAPPILPSTSGVVLVQQNGNVRLAKRSLTNAYFERRVTGGTLAP